jgi:hypothetical protein
VTFRIERGEKEMVRGKELKQVVLDPKITKEF